MWKQLIAELGARGCRIWVKLTSSGGTSKSATFTAGIINRSLQNKGGQREQGMVCKDKHEQCKAGKGTERHAKLNGRAGKARAGRGTKYGNTIRAERDRTDHEDDECIHGRENEPQQE